MVRKLLATLAFVAAGTAPAAFAADVHVSIGINVPTYPTLVRVPNYPVYYAPRVHANYFFYDGLYWVFQGGEWYTSVWYNGPWDLVPRYDVPVAVLRVPVRYYRAPPSDFRVYRVDAAPRWESYWGPTWVERRAYWNEGSLASVPIAPLPVYQRQYSGTRYPALSQQVTIQTSNYRYQPRDQAVRQQYVELRNRATRADGTVATARQGKGPPAHAKAYGYRAKQEGVVTTDVQGGPPAHAPAHGYRAKQQREADRIVQRADDDNPGRGKGHDKERGKGHGQGKGKGHDKDG